MAKKERLWCVNHIINHIIKALIYSKGVSKLKRLIISISNYIKFNFIWQRGFIGKLYNIIKYIMRLTRHCKDFAENQLKAYIEDELFNYVKLLFIKDRGVQ